MLLLTWDHPLEVNAISARLIRGSVVVAEDITWGVAVDHESDDTTQPYCVEYYGPANAPTTVIQSADIRKFVMPASVCEVIFELTRADGTPDSNRLIDISDMHEAGEPEYLRSYATNFNGKARIFLRRGYRQYIHLENTRLGLDVIVPDQASISYDDLIALGSRIPHDRRGWF